jgi:hypothetical protein
MTNETKQTAVEWQHLELSKFPYGKSEFTDAIDILIKAKEMENEQHADTWDDSRVEDMGDNYIGKQKSFNEYYNETYGGNK